MRRERFYCHKLINIICPFQRLDYVSAISPCDFQIHHSHSVTVAMAYGERSFVNLLEMKVSMDPVDQNELLTKRHSCSPLSLQPSPPLQAWMQYSRPPCVTTSIGVDPRLSGEWLVIKDIKSQSRSCFSNDRTNNKILTAIRYILITGSLTR